MLKNKYTKKAFTLIELLVVITIIGILATGGIAVYTAQIKKARDSVRVSDLKVLQSAVTQVYQGVDGQYPKSNKFLYDIKPYVDTVPGDKKNGQSCYSSGSTTTYCGYAYKPADDSGGIEFGAYELSIAFEQEGNIKAKADNNEDNGDDSLRYEMGAGHSSVSIETKVASDGFKGKKGAIKIDGSGPGENDLIIINKKS